jgi:hypothetical protein
MAVSCPAARHLATHPVTMNLSRNFASESLHDLMLRRSILLAVTAAVGLLPSSFFRDKRLENQG